MSHNFPDLASEFVRWEVALDHDPLFLLTVRTVDFDTDDGAPLEMRLAFDREAMGRLLANGVGALAKCGDPTALAIQDVLAGRRGN
jgi:hypothetical protein